MAKPDFKFKLKNWDVEVTRRGSYRGSGNAYYEFVFTNHDYTITDQILVDHNDFYFTAKTVKAEADDITLSIVHLSSLHSRAENLFSTFKNDSLKSLFPSLISMLAK